MKKYAVSGALFLSVSSVVFNPLYTVKAQTNPIIVSQNSLDTKVITLRLSDTGVSVGGILTWGLGGLIQKKIY